MKKITFILLISLPILTHANSFLLVGNLAGAPVMSKRGYQGSVMEKFDNLNTCKIAGEAFLNNWTSAYDGKPFFGKIECIDLKSTARPVVIFFTEN